MLLNCDFVDINLYSCLILFLHEYWQFVRPSASTYIRVYESGGRLVESVDVTSSSVVYPQSTSGRQLSFPTSYNFQRGINYYILFDEGKH